MSAAVTISGTNGTTSVVAIGGASPNILSVTQSVVHVNSVLGSDTNDGLTAGTALKTWAGFLSRIGYYTLYPGLIDAYIYEDMDPSGLDPLVVNGFYGPGVGINIHGVTKVLASGTITAVQALNTGTDVSCEITAGSFDFSAYVGSLVRINTGSPNGPSYCWVRAALTGPVRASVGHVGQRDGSIDGFENVVTPITGQTFDILKLPKVYASYFSEGTPEYGPSWLIEFLAFVTSTNQFAHRVPSAYWLSYECSFDAAFVNATKLTQVANCLFTTSLTVVSNFQNALGLVLNAPAAIQMQSGVWTCYGMTWQNATMLNDPNTLYGGIFSSHHVSFGLWAFGCTAPVLAGHSSASKFIFEAGLYGSGNTSHLIDVSNGGEFTVGSTGKILATTSQNPPLRINNQTSLPAMDPSTYALTAARTMTVANLEAAVSSGGFGGAIFDPRDQRTRISIGV